MKRLMMLACALFTMNCAAVSYEIENGQPVVNGWRYRAMATPFGALYFGHSGDDSWVRYHEECHVQRMRDYGPTDYIFRYFAEPAWGCQEEYACGWAQDHPHPACWIEDIKE